MVKSRMRKEVRYPVLDGPFTDIWKNRIFKAEGQDFVVRRRKFVEDEVAPGMREIAKLHDRYGIAIPQYYESRAGFQGITEPGQRSVVVRYVDGFSMHDAFASGDYDLSELQDSADQVCSGFCQYFRDIYEKGGLYLFDIHKGQFMYGKTSQDSSPKFYLVDIDPYIKRLRPGNKDGPLAEDFFKQGPDEVAQMVLYLEEKFPGLNLAKSHDALQSFSEEIPSNSWIGAHMWYVMPTFFKLTRIGFSES